MSSYTDITNESFVGKGKAYIGTTTSKLRPVGNVEVLNLSIAQETKKQADFTKGGGGNVNSFSRITEVKGNITLTDYSKENLALALFGSSSVVSAGYVINEAVTVYTGGISSLANIKPADVVVNDAQFATGTLTFSGTGTADDTVTINARAYTLKATIGATADQVLVGATATATRDNLLAAINLGTGSGTLYGSATTVNADVYAYADTVGGAPVIVLRAKTAGTAGNSVTTTESGTGASFGGATLSGGAGTAAVATVTTDYTVEKAGIFIPESSTLTDGQTVYVSYTYPVQHDVQAVTTSQAETVMVFEGLNEAQSGAEVVAKVYKAKISPASSVALLTDDYGKLEMEFECLKDETVVADGKSQYFQIRKIPV